jgi:hypothetical protein
MCADTKTIVGAAADNFASIAGDVIASVPPGFRRSNVWLEGATNCWVNPEENKLVCYWGNISQNMAEFRAAALATQIARCLGRPIPEVSDSGYEMTTDGAAIRIHAEDMDTDVVGVGAVYVTASRPF